MNGKCDCCGHAFSGEEYDICTECWWEKESFSAQFPDQHCYVNGTTLRKARANYAEYGACNPHGLWCKTGKYPDGATS